MNTIINTENYEAYLLDYLEGNLRLDKAKQLKAFVTAQGMDWDELTEDLPHLEAPAVVYQDKESLKKKGAVVPLYVKIASAAAAAGLLLTVTLWPDKTLPKIEPIAELKPILPERLITGNEISVLPPRTIQFIQPQTIVKEKSSFEERVEAPLLAELEPQKTHSLSANPIFDEPDFELLAYQMNTNLNFAQYDGNGFTGSAEDERDLSFIGRGIYRLTDGRHDSFGSLIGAGVQKAKQDFTEAATDFALTAYFRADEHFDEVKENWQERRGE